MRHQGHGANLTVRNVNCQKQIGRGCRARADQPATAAMGGVNFHYQVRQQGPDLVGFKFAEKIIPLDNLQWPKNRDIEARHS